MEAFIHRYYNVLFAILLLCIIGVSFYLGSLQGQKGEVSGVTLSCNDQVLKTLAIPLGNLAVSSNQDTKPASSGQFVGSKNGTKYYTPGCAGAKRIKPENIIWFQNAEDATLQGYTPATC